MSLYSVVISPPEEIINEVAAMKQQLKNSIGRYPSCNSLAHITFNVFIGNEETLQRWERFVGNFVMSLLPMQLHFDKTGYFGNGAFFIAPDENSKIELVKVMKNFHKQFPAPAHGKSKEPHISIGRQLNEEQLAIAKELFPAANLSFTCDNLVIRKFNEERKQYDIYKRFDFPQGLY